VKLWDVASGKELATLKTGAADQTGSVAFSPDGRILAAPADETVYLWDVATRGIIAALKRVTDTEGYWVTGSALDVAFSPDGKTLVAADWEGKITLYDVASAKSTATVRPHTGPVTCLAFSPDGKTLAVGGKQEAIKISNLRPAKQPDQ
jgi:WD40 repeat protein